MRHKSPSSAQHAAQVVWLSPSPGLAVVFELLQWIDIVELAQPPDPIGRSTRYPRCRQQREAHTASRELGMCAVKCLGLVPGLPGQLGGLLNRPPGTDVGTTNRRVRGRSRSRIRYSQIMTHEPNPYCKLGPHETGPTFDPKTTQKQKFLKNLIRWIPP